MDFDKFTFRQLDAGTTIKSFDCGDADLNDFLFSDASNYYKSMMALTRARHICLLSIGGTI